MNHIFKQKLVAGTLLGTCECGVSYADKIHTVTVEEKTHHKYAKSISMPGEQCAVCGFQKDNLRHFIATPASNDNPFKKGGDNLSPTSNGIEELCACGNPLKGHRGVTGYCTGGGVVVGLAGGSGVGGIEENAWEGQIVSLVGEASMCWNPIPTGVFDSEEAMLVAYKIVKIARAVADKARKQGHEEAQLGLNAVEWAKSKQEGFEAALGEVSTKLTERGNHWQQIYKESMPANTLIGYHADSCLHVLSDLESFVTNLKKKQ